MDSGIYPIYWEKINMTSKNSTSTKRQKITLLDIVNLIRQGHNPSSICKLTGMTKQHLNYYLSTLKSRNQIRKIGYGTWELTNQEVKTSTKDTLTKGKEVRGHAFIWKIRLKGSQRSIDWISLLKSKGIEFSYVGLRNTPRIVLNGHKTWFGAKNIIIYESESFFAVNAIESRKQGIQKIIEIINELGKVLDIDLSKNLFTVNREHYSLVQNSLAIQLNKEGKKLTVYENGKGWFMIDNSLNLNEAETVSQSAMTDSLGIQKYFNSHKQTGFKVTPEFILNTMNGIQNNQMLFAENIKTHIKAIQDLGNGVERLTKIVERLESE